MLQLYNNPRGLFDVPRLFRGIMLRHGIVKPIWINETNVVPWDDPVAPLPRDRYRATLDEQASYILQATAYALAAGVERLAVYKMVDDAGLLSGVDEAFGLVRHDEQHSPRPVFAAYGTALREMAPTARAQLVDEGPVVRVYLEQPALGRLLTVIWNTSGVPSPVLVRPLGRRAMAMDKFGNTRPLQAGTDGLIHLVAAAATANTLPGYPDSFFIGGDPVMVLEPLPVDYRPLEPTVAGLDPAADQPRTGAPPLLP